VGYFDEILKTASAEDQAVLNKYPQLKASMEQLEGDVAKLTPYAQYGAQWRDWERQNWDAEAGMTKREKELADELAAAQERLTSAQTSGSGASAGEIAALKKEFETKLNEVNANAQRSMEGMNYFYGRAVTKLLPHQQEFGEAFDPKVLYEFMQKSGINDPDLAYDRMVAGRRGEIAATKQKELEAKHVADLEAARQEGYNKRAQEVAMGSGGMLPTDSTGGIAGVTAFMSKPATISDEVKAKAAEAKLGDGSLAAMGLQMLQRGELPTQ
jgi:uncharacterized protein (DUF3084 family)